MEREAIIKEIKETILEAKLSAVDIFGEDEIKSTEVFKKEAQSAHEHARRVEKVLGQEREKIVSLTKAIDEKEGKIKTLNEVVSKTQVKTLFDGAKDVRKLDDREKGFIEKRLNGFKSDKEGDALKLEFDKFLDTQIADYIETAKLLGVEIKPKGDGDNAGKSTSSDGQGGGSDLTDPKQNDFIPA